MPPPGGVSQQQADADAYAAEVAASEAASAFAAGNADAVGKLKDALIVADEPNEDQEDIEYDQSDPGASKQKLEAQIEQTQIARATKIAAAIDEFVTTKIQQILESEP